MKSESLDNVLLSKTQPKDDGSLGWICRARAIRIIRKVNVCGDKVLLICFKLCIVGRSLRNSYPVLTMKLWDTSIDVECFRVLSVHPKHWHHSSLQNQQLLLIRENKKKFVGITKHELKVARRHFVHDSNLICIQSIEQSWASWKHRDRCNHPRKHQIHRPTQTSTMQVLNDRQQGKRDLKSTRGSL